MSTEPAEQFGIGIDSGAGRSEGERRALLSSYSDVDLDAVWLEPQLAGRGGRGLYDTPPSPATTTTSSSSAAPTPPRVPAAAHVANTHIRREGSSSSLLVPSPAPLIDAATTLSLPRPSTSTWTPAWNTMAADEPSASPAVVPASAQHRQPPSQRDDDPYHYHVYPDNPIAAGPPVPPAGAQHQQHPGAQASTPPAVSSTTPPPTPPKPGHSNPSSSTASSPPQASTPPSSVAYRTSTSPPPRTGSFKAFASSPLATANGGPSSSPSVSSAPFLVLTSGTDGGGLSAGQRGSTLTDGPRPSTAPGAGNNNNNNTSTKGGQPTPRSSHSSSASSSLPINGSGSLSASTSSNGPSPPLANPTTSNSGTFVSPFARPGTRPMLTPSPASGSIGSMAGFAFAGLPPPPPRSPSNGALHASATSGSLGSNRGSMILYRLSAGDEGIFSTSNSGFSALSNNNNNGGGGVGPSPPGLAHMYGSSSLRHSAFYSETDSLTLDGDSKYPPFLPGGGANGSSGMGTPASMPGSPGVPAGTSPFTLGMRSSLAELSGLGRAQGGLVAYVYDPDEDDDDDEDYEYEDEYYGGGGDKGRKEREEKRREEWMHDPSEVNALYAERGKRAQAGGAPGSPMTPGTPAKLLKGKGTNSSTSTTGIPGSGGATRPPGAPRRAQYRPPPSSGISARGIVNVTTLVALTVGLLCLFIVLPVAKAFTDNGVALKILGNTRINATGQAERRELRADEGLGRREWRIDWEQER